MVEDRISWKGLNMFAQDCSNDDLGLTLSLNGKVKFAVVALLWEKFNEFVEDFGATVENTLLLK